MNNSDVLITFASWEDRFRIGFDRDLEKVDAHKAIVFYFDSYVDWTRKNRDIVSQQCAAKDIDYVPVALDIDKPANNWQRLLEYFEHPIPEYQDTLIDISTMPREIMWYVLWMVKQNSRAVRFVYHSPEKYGTDWLSRDPRAPRFVYKLSGVALPAAKTALIVTVGYDPQRVRRLLNWCEPVKSLIGVQSGSYFPRNEEAMAEYEILEKEYNCEIFELDAFADDFGLIQITEKLETLGSSYNIIMGSLGPKLTAITLYKLQRQRDNIGLVYAPSNQFNENYSTGIGKCFQGTI